MKAGRFEVMLLAVGGALGLWRLETGERVEWLRDDGILVMWRRP